MLTIIIGSIRSLEFVDLMKQIRQFRMSEHIQENLLSVSFLSCFNNLKLLLMIIQVAGGSAGRKVSYPYFKAFNQMLGNMDLFRNVMETVCADNGHTTQGKRERDIPPLNGVSL